MLFGRTLRRAFPGFAELAAILAHRSYLADGLLTRHAADFLADAKFRDAYAKGKATGSWLSMEPAWRVYTACWAAAHGAGLPGDFVECGVNRGGMALTIMEYLDFNALPKRFFLLDTYSGFPRDAEVAPANRGLYGDCYAEVVARFAPYRGAVIVRGRVPETLAQIDSAEIAFLSIDMNNAAPEVAAVRQLWPRLSAGAAVLLDDYGSTAHRPQKQAMDALAAELGFRILALPSGQGLVIKGAAHPLRV